MKVRTNIELDEKLIDQAKKYTVKKTKKAIVEEALEFYIRQHKQSSLLELFGTLEWEGDLDEMRKS